MIERKKVLIYLMLFLLFSIKSYAKLPDKTDIGEEPGKVFIELNEATKKYRVYTEGLVQGERAKISRKKWFELVRWQDPKEPKPWNGYIKFLQEEGYEIIFDDEKIQFPNNSSSFFSIYQSDYINSHFRRHPEYKVHLTLNFKANIDTSNIENINFLFTGLHTNIKGDISNWNLSNVKYMKSSFAFIPIEDFNVDFSKYNTSKVKSMKGLFADSNFNPQVKEWETNNVIDMSYMFANTLNANPDVSKFRTSNVEDMTSMFNNARAATLRLHNDKTVVTKDEISQRDDTFENGSFQSENIGVAMTIPKKNGVWDVSKLKSAYSMFRNAPVADPEIGEWKSYVLETTENMFRDTVKARAENFRNFNTSRVKDMSGMFAGAYVSNPDVTIWDTSSVKNMEEVFYNTKIANPNVSNWITEEVENMHSMFNNAKGATLRLNETNNLPLTKEEMEQRDDTFENGAFLNNNIGIPMTITKENGIWDVRSVKTMSYMFAYTDFADPELNTWQAISLENTMYMFDYSKKARLENSASFYTPNLKNTSHMFRAAKVANPDTRNWVVDNVEEMDYMFEYTLANPDVSLWKTFLLRNAEGMFYNNKYATLRIDPNTNKPVTREMMQNRNDEFKNGAFLQPNKWIAMTISKSDGTWDVSSLENASRMFMNTDYADPELTNWDAKNLTTTSEMFRNTKQARVENSEIFETPLLENMNYMFYNAKISNPNVTNWDVSNVKTMIGTFKNTTITNPNVYKWKTVSLENAEEMFRSANGATLRLKNNRPLTVEEMNARIDTTSKYEEFDSRLNKIMPKYRFDNPNEGVSMTISNSDGSWDVSSLEIADWMFANNDISDPELTNWNAINLRTAVGMFYKNKKSRLENSGTFLAPNLRDARHMFEHSKLANPDLSNWKTSNLVNISRMFNNAENAQPITSNWKTDSLLFAEEAFKNANRANPDIRSWDLSQMINIDYFLYNVDGAYIDLSNFRHLPTISNNYLKVLNKKFELVLPGAMFSHIDLNKIAEGYIEFFRLDEQDYKYQVIEVINDASQDSKNTYNICTEEGNKCTTNTELFYPEKDQLTNRDVSYNFIPLDKETGYLGFLKNDANYIFRPHISARLNDHVKKESSDNDKIQAYQFEEITKRDADGILTNEIKDKFIDQIFANIELMRQEKPGFVVNLLEQDGVYPTFRLGQNAFNVEIVYPNENGVLGNVKELKTIYIYVNPVFDDTKHQNQTINVKFITDETRGTFKDGTSEHTLKTYIGSREDENTGTKFSYIIERLKSDKYVDETGRVIKIQSKLPIINQTKNRFIYWVAQKTGEIISPDKFIVNHKNAERLKDSNGDLIFEAKYLFVSMVNNRLELVEGENIARNKRIMMLNPDILNKLQGIVYNGIGNELTENNGKKIDYKGLKEYSDLTSLGIKIENNGIIKGNAIFNNWENDDIIITKPEIIVLFRVSAQEVDNPFVDGSIAIQVKRNRDRELCATNDTREYQDVCNPDDEKEVRGSFDLSLKKIKANSTNYLNVKSLEIDILKNQTEKTLKNINEYVVKNVTDDIEIVRITRKRDGSYILSNNKFILTSTNSSEKYPDREHISLKPTDNVVVKNINLKEIKIIAKNSFKKDAINSSIQSNTVEYNTDVQKVILLHNFLSDEPTTPIYESKDLDRHILISKPDEDIRKIEIYITKENNETKLVYEYINSDFILNENESTTEDKKRYQLDFNDIIEKENEEYIKLHLPYNEDISNQKYRQLDGNKYKVIFSDIHDNISKPSNTLFIKTKSLASNDKKNYKDIPDNTKYQGINNVIETNITVDLLENIKLKLIRYPQINSVEIKKCDSCVYNVDENNKQIIIFNEKGEFIITIKLKYYDGSFKEVDLKVIARDVVRILSDIDLRGTNVNNIEKIGEKTRDGIKQIDYNYKNPVISEDGRIKEDGLIEGFNYEFYYLNSKPKAQQIDEKNDNSILDNTLSVEERYILYKLGKTNLVITKDIKNITIQNAVKQINGKNYNKVRISPVYLNANEWGDGSEENYKTNCILNGNMTCFEKSDKYISLKLVEKFDDDVTIEKIVKININLLRDTDKDGLIDIIDKDDDDDNVLDIVEIQNGTNPKHRLSNRMKNIHEPIKTTEYGIYFESTDIIENPIPEAKTFNILKDDNTRDNTTKYYHFESLDKIIKVPTLEPGKDFIVLVEQNDINTINKLKGKVLNDTGDPFNIMLTIKYKDDSIDKGTYLKLRIYDKFPPEIELAKENLDNSSTFTFINNNEYKNLKLADAFDKSGIKSFNMYMVNETSDIVKCKLNQDNCKDAELPNGLTFIHGENMPDNIAHEYSKDGKIGYTMKLNGILNLKDVEFKRSNLKRYTYLLYAKDKTNKITTKLINIHVVKLKYEANDIYIPKGIKIEEPINLIKNKETLFEKGLVDKNSFSWDMEYFKKLGYINQEKIAIKSGDTTGVINVREKNGKVVKIKVNVIIYDEQKYVKRLEDLRYDDVSIKNYFDKRVFFAANTGPFLDIAKDVLTKGKFTPRKLLSGLKFGVSLKPFINKDINLVLFADYENNRTNYLMVGTGFRKKDLFNYIIRYRFSLLEKNKNFNENFLVGHNIDVYADYNKEFKINKLLSIKPTLGTYISFGGMKLDNRFSGIMSDASLNFATKLNFNINDNLVIYTEPEFKMAYKKNTLWYTKNNKFIPLKPNGHLIYNLAIGVNKNVNKHFDIGANFRYLGRLNSIRDLIEKKDDINNFVNAINLEIITGYKF